MGEMRGIRASTNLAYVAGAILVCAVLVAAALIIPARTITLTTTTTTTTTFVETVLGTAGNTTLTGTPLLAECPTQVPTPWFGTLNASKSRVTICFQFYEFNSTSPVVLDLASILRIYGFSLQTGESFGGNGNFTINPGVAQISLGGPNNENEGTIVEYSISAKPGASGTYHIVLNGMLLRADAPLFCTGGAGRIIAGDGRPDYATLGSCLMDGGTSGAGFKIPGVNYSVTSNTLFYRIIGAGNSTA